MKFFDRVKETSTSTGTGNFTLAGAVAQFVSFSSVFKVGDIIPYAIVGQTGTDWETGAGYLSDSTTLVRQTVYFSSNNNALVNFGAATYDVYCTIPGYQMTRFEPMGHSLSKSLGYDMP